jgi:alkylation response protein AidB-like acyl-CoA dehydrogenase
LDLLLTPEQELLQDTARKLFARACPIEAVRAAEAADQATVDGIWDAAAANGLLRIGIPELQGGNGGGLLDLAVVHGEIGRALAPGPFLESAMLAASMLAATESTDARRLLAAIMSGESVVVPATQEPGVSVGELLAATATRLSAGGVLCGTATMVPYADSADYLLVVARDEGAGELVLCLVGTDQPGVRLAYLPNIAGIPSYVVTLESVTVSENSVLTRGDALSGLWRRLLPQAALMRSAQIVGAGERLLELTVAYARQREQFGRPVGSYQAVQYLCSDLAIEVQLSAAFVRYAAGRFDNGADVGRDIALANAWAKRAARRIAHCTHEVHAGFAFMTESDIQLYTRRLKHWELDLGDERHHRLQVADALLGPIGV